MSETTNAYNERRKERFIAAGIDERDIPSAQMAFLGEGESNCTLCDHEIKYCFRLDFPAIPAKPQRQYVSFEPVGSNCITNWIEAMPESPEKEAARARLAAAEKLKNELVARKRAEQDAAKRRAATIEALRNPEEKRLMQRFEALPEAARTDTLVEMSDKLLRYGNFKSDAQRGFFSARLREAEGSGRRPTPPPPARPSTPPNAAPRGGVAAAPAPPPPPAPQGFPPFAVPECPKCKGETRRRTSARGPFFGCVRYPECNGIINVFVPKGQQALPFPPQGSPAAASAPTTPPPSPEALARARQARAEAVRTPSTARPFGSPVVSAADVARETGQEAEVYGEPDEYYAEDGTTMQGPASGEPEDSGAPF